MGHFIHIQSVKTLQKQEYIGVNQEIQYILYDE